MWRKGRKQGWKEGLNRWKVGGGMEESLVRMKDEAVRQKVIEKRQTYGRGRSLNIFVSQPASYWFPPSTRLSIFSPLTCPH